ncbi:uncharacterized protein LOC144660439 isoform X1 [Oculina patagonica]
MNLLSLQNNNISFISNETFAKTINLWTLFLNDNQLKRIPRGAFYNIHPNEWFGSHMLLLSDNPIEIIEPEAFRWGTFKLEMYIYLLRTKLKMLSLESFIGHSVQDSHVVIQNRAVANLVFVTAVSQSSVTIHLNAINSLAEAVRVEYPTDPFSQAKISSLLASGFRRIHDNNTDVAILLPCPLGTFSNFSTKGKNGCTNCPPGGFYSDDVGYVGISCKKCPNGSFVSFDKAPGTSKQDCKSCPEGTETDFFAGYRACQCLEEFYRTHMFEKCHKCVRGLKCQNDYFSLKAGFWWEWRNKSYKDRYRDFIVNILKSSPALDAESVQYQFPIPTPYKCPVDESCKGGLDSPCGNGYEGPLCQVCSSGYYKQLQTCIQCPNRKWIVGQLSIIAAIVFILTVALLWTSKKSKKKGGNRSLIDMFFSKLKIVVGFYQVTNGLLQAFAYIKWPGSLQAVGKYSEILQMDLLQIAPLNCLFSRFRVDAFGSLLAMMAINGAIIGLSLVAYRVRKIIILWNQNLQNDDKLRKISQTKELVFRNLFFFLYVTYLSTCAKTASVLPIACQKLCRDDKEELCYKYMKADYSIQCQGKHYNLWLIVAYISTAYIVVLPVSSFIALWKKRRAILTTTDANAGSGMEIISALRFLFENYEHRAWYWELVETSRKVILTSGLILVGQESRSYIGLAWVIAGMYGMLFSWIKPIQDVTENRLMATSLAISVVNLGIGAVSRIPAENLPASNDTYTDAVLVNILVVGANTLVIGLLVVQNAVFLYRFLKEWRKNPHWSFSCCLGLLLPLNDLQGEIRGLAGGNVLKHQLQTGQIDKPTIFSTVKNSGALDVTFEDGEQSDNNAVEIVGENCLEAEHSGKIREQGTQTELCLIPVTDFVTRRPMTDSNEKSMCRQSIPAVENTGSDKGECSTVNEAGKEAVKYHATSPWSKKRKNTGH